VNSDNIQMKKAAVINDLSGFGRCSLTAQLPVLSVMGIEACPLPTAVLTNQTGYDSFYCDDYTDKLDTYTAQWHSMGKSFDGISTGYLANAKQIDKILNFISVFKKEDTLLLVDPVMADGGEIYATYTKELCEGVKNLAMQADVITPNLTALCILAGEDYHSIVSCSSQHDYLDRISAVAKSLIRGSVKTVVVTGIHHMTENGEFIYNGIFTEDASCFSKSQIFKGSFSGTGDLFSSVIFGALLNGMDINSAVEMATAFVEKAIAETMKFPHDPCDGVDFQKCLDMLIKR